MAPQIADILQCLRADRAPNDRRRSPRVGLRARISIRFGEAGRSPLLGWMRDVSCGGAGLLLGGDLSVDHQIVLRIPSRDRGVVSVRGRVVHCTKVGSFFRVGVEFLDKGWQTDHAESGLAGELQALEEHMRCLRPAVMD